MSNALIGYSGYVGTTILRQAKFERLYRSTNIQEIDGLQFDTVVCSAAPAQKWIANRDPAADMEKISGLIQHLEKIRCNTFILISTVDVFKEPKNVYEDSLIDESGLHAYGLHRRLLEKFVQSRFEKHLIVRLPGLVGPGLRKNVIFDFLNQNKLDAVDSRAVFQFYPMVNLWYDIEVALRAGLKILHLTSEPVCVEDVSVKGFGKPFQNVLSVAPACYDMKTRHADVFGVEGSYQYSARETIQAIRAYAQSEQISLPEGLGV